MPRIYEPDLAVELAERLRCSHAFAEQALLHARLLLIEHLESGNEIHLSGFGTFHLKQVGAKTLKNPQTGKPVPVAAHKCPAWRPADPLKRRLR